jgi:ketosteroid isomerase-like protein
MDDALPVVQRFYSLLTQSDGAGALELLDPDIEWTEAERTPYFEGTMRGIDAVVSGLFEPLRRDFDNFTTIPHEFVTEKEHVVAFGRYSGLAKKSRRTLSAPFVHLWTVSNGRLRRFIQYTDSTPWQEALAAPRDV